MLRRNSSNRLDRRKSTSSVHSKHDSIDPEVARQQAQAAATYAFARAQERNSADMSHSAGHTRNNSVQTNRPPLSRDNSASGQEPIVRRQQSVRFTGPNATTRRQSIGTRAHNSVVAKASSATLKPMAMTTDTPVPAAYRPPSRSSSIGKGSVSKGTAESFVTSVGAYDEYYTPEDDVASTPSSYRRIRKSKSMFAPLNAPDVFYTNGTPDIGSPVANTSQTPQSQSTQAPLRVQRSMSFLRGGRDYMTPFRERNDAAVQLARDRFFHQTTQQRLREQPSFLFRSKKSRQEKPFRKSVRSSSANSTGQIGSIDQDQSSKEPGLRDKARKVSKTIKGKLRILFGRSKEEPMIVPNQQVEAPETHVRDYAGDTDPHESFAHIPHPDEAAISRVASRVPSIRAVASNQRLRSHAGSVKSFKSDHSDDDKSRVTSWDSTAVNTITSHGAHAMTERDRQRLSIINENGTHFSTSSFRRPQVTNQFSAYPAFHRPTKSASHVPAPMPGPVNSARVYSALMKRLDESSPNAKLEASRKGSVESFSAFKNIPERSSSVNSSRGNRTPATIRHVISGSSGSSEGHVSQEHDHQWVREDSIHAAHAEEVFGRTGPHVHQWVTADPLREARMRSDDDVFSPKSNEYNGDTVVQPELNRRNSNASTTALSRQTSTKTSYYTVPENAGLTPQEIATRNEPMIRESRSTFFGGSAFNIVRTTSPYRRALAESDDNPAITSRGTSTPTQKSPLQNPSFKGAALLTIPNIDGQEEGEAYSESIYSRTTSGQTPAAANSALSLIIAQQEDASPLPTQTPSVAGDVIIIGSSTYRPAMPAGAHRVTSSASSNEWKGWMASEVAKLEKAKENTNAAASYVNYALPTMPKSFHTGHVRENAQINDDDTDIAQRKVSAVKQPLGIVQQNIQTRNPTLYLKPILKNRSAVSLLENVEPALVNSIPVPPPPPIPARSPLRSVQSKSSLSSVGTAVTSRTRSAPASAVKIPSLSGRNILHKRNGSTGTLKSMISMKSVETPAKLVKRNGRPSNYTCGIPSPGGGLSAAVEKQFGSASTRARSRSRALGVGENRENRSPRREEPDDEYGTDGAGLMGPAVRELDAQAMGSKRMVDLFLSSRRKRMASGSTDGGMFV
ncbi:hypothetical protein B7494_g5455 [Chlorociboria aeruginascens]|nr:hypothetical protein B7494_g5455 [Chlorociboria aeruginascens]